MLLTQNCIFFLSVQATVCFVIALCLSVAAAQIFGFGSSHNALTGDFGGPTAFAGLPAQRDPRQNRGE